MFDTDIWGKGREKKLREILTLFLVLSLSLALFSPSFAWLHTFLFYCEQLNCISHCRFFFYVSVGEYCVSSPGICRWKRIDASCDIADNYLWNSLILYCIRHPLLRLRMHESLEWAVSFYKTHWRVTMLPGFSFSFLLQFFLFLFLLQFFSWGDECFSFILKDAWLSFWIRYRRRAHYVSWRLNISVSQDR